MAKVSGLYIYPVKSCAGISLKNAYCSELGLRHDREWAVVGENGKVVTQRDFAKMALIQTAISDDDGGKLTLSMANAAPLVVSSGDSRKPMRADVWGAVTGGFDEGDEAAEWLSKYLGAPVRLVRKDLSDERVTKIAKPNGEFAPLTYYDAMPVLVMSDESLSDLNSRMEHSVPMDRFRPSIVVSGLGPFGEDNAEELRVGGVKMFRGKPCARCVIITIDQSTGEKRDTEPLRALSKYRLQGEKAMMGQYFMPAGSGVISLGDEVQ